MRSETILVVSNNDQSAEDLVRFLAKDYKVAWVTSSGAVEGVATSAFFTSAAEIKDFIKETGPALVIVTSEKSHQWAVVCNKSKVPVLYFVTRLSGDFRQLNEVRLSHFIVHSENTRKLLLGLEHTSVTTIPKFLNTGRTKVESSKGCVPTNAEKRSIKWDKYTVLLATDNIGLFVDTMAALPFVDFLWPISKVVLDELPNLYRYPAIKSPFCASKCHACVCWMTDETIPIPALESMYFGKDVICFNNSAMATTFGSYLYVLAGDTKGTLVHFLTKHSYDPDSVFGSRPRDYVIKQCDVGVAIPKVKKLIENVIP
jgi:hypothetical protein